MNGRPRGSIDQLQLLYPPSICFLFLMYDVIGVIPCRLPSGSNGARNTNLFGNLLNGTNSTNHNTSAAAGGTGTSTATTGDVSIPNSLSPGNLGNLNQLSTLRTLQSAINGVNAPSNGHNAVNALNLNPNLLSSLLNPNANTNMNANGGGNGANVNNTAAPTVANPLNASMSSSAPINSLSVSNRIFLCYRTL